VCSAAAMEVGALSAAGWASSYDVVARNFPCWARGWLGALGAVDTRFRVSVSQPAADAEQ